MLVDPRQCKILEPQPGPVSVATTTARVFKDSYLELDEEEYLVSKDDKGGVCGGGKINL